MSFNKLGLATVVAMVLSAGSAMAADIPSDTGTITFHGMVSNNTCKVSLDQKIDQDGNDFDVNLDTVFVKTSLMRWVPPAPWEKRNSPSP